MLGYVISEGRGVADLCLATVARELVADGWPLAGAVQVNTDRADASPCDMDLQVIGPDRIIRISQNLGSLSKGCRLDPSGLEQAVGLVEQALELNPRLLIVNKFGKQESEGRGFRPVIGRALGQGVPVLTAVNAGSLTAFHDFAEGLAAQITLDLAAIRSWCHEVMRRDEG
ncbi:MAG: DUF2478 domain-containing protein [Albidovulum sp.]